MGGGGGGSSGGGWIVAAGGWRSLCWLARLPELLVFQCVSHIRTDVTVSENVSLSLFVSVPIIT